MSETLLESLRGRWIFRQGFCMHARENMFPDCIQNTLHIVRSARHGKNCIVLRHDNAKLPKRTISAIDIMSAAPELEAIALIPIVVGIVSIGYMLSGGLFYPRFRHDSLPVPYPTLQIELTKFREIHRSQSQSSPAQIDALLIRLPQWLINPQRLKQAWIEIFH